MVLAKTFNSYLHQTIAVIVIPNIHRDRGGFGGSGRGRQFRRGRFRPGRGPAGPNEQHQSDNNDNQQQNSCEFFHMKAPLVKI